MSRTKKYAAVRRRFHVDPVPQTPAEKPSAENAAATSFSKRKLLTGIDPAELVDLLENHYTDVDSSWYRGGYARAQASFLAKDGRGQSQALATFLSEIDDMTGFEDASRQAGFVVGFECCRRLLLGELDLATVKAGGTR